MIEVMKRLVGTIIVAMAAMAAISCMKEEDSFMERSLTFVAEYADATKTVLAEGNSVLWLPGDEIAVSGAEDAFKASTSRPDDYTVFTGSALPAEDYYAVYPYSLHKTWSASVATVEVPQMQRAVKGSFADDLNISVASATSKNMSFKFHNILGYVKFSVSQASGNIRSVTVKTGNGEPLAGTVTVDCSADRPSASPAGSLSSSVVLTSDEPLETGDYYIALLPGTYSAGLTFVFEDGEGKSAERTISSSITLDPGKIKRIGDAPAPEASVPDEWITKDFYHRSLIMKFTGTWCGYCPSMDEAIESAVALHPDKFELAYMHVGDNYQPDCAYYFEDRFAVYGYPTGISDFRAKVPNYSPSSYTAGLFSKVLEEKENNYPVTTGISFTSSLSGSTVKADVKVYAKKADDYKVTVLLLEDGIVGYQNGGGYDYVHDHVVRLVMSSTSGDDAAVASDNTVWSKTYTGTVPSGCNTSNLRILVYVEKPYGNQNKVQGVTNVEYGSYGDSYVDNCRSEKVGVEAVLQYSDDPDLGYVYESEDYSADGTVVTLQKATKGNGIDIVFLGDAYNDKDIADGSYETVMRTAYDAFFTEEPYKSFKDHFNVYYVNVVSKHDFYGGETAFEGYFGYGTEVGGDDEKAFDYAQKAISEERVDESLIVIMMNSTAYAGTCYMYGIGVGDYGRGPSVSYFPVGNDDVELSQVLLHETGGHGFAKLDDEYAYEDYGGIPADEIEDHHVMEAYGWWKNVDFTDVESEVKWAKYLEDERYANDGLGIFEGASTYWTGAYRPTENSIMRHNTDGFNAPSREAIYYRIHKLAYGDSWQYDHEAFVEYDAVNRAAAASSMQKKRVNSVERTFVPTAPPVVVKGSWRDAGKKEYEIRILQDTI